MSHPPPGPYAVPPPQTVQRAFVFMLIAAAITAVNVVISFAYEGELQQKINNAINTDTVTSSQHSVNLFSTATGGVLGVGLWIWMAYANRSGHDWARITGTVFFGISCLSLVGGLVIAGLVSQWLIGIAVVSAVCSVVEWLLGLFVIILLWNKRSGEYFSPQTGYPMPYGYPGYPGGPGVPYTYPVMPQQMQQQNGVPQQPTDPWATPNG